MTRLWLALGIALFCLGCKASPGTNVQASGVGLNWQPLGSSPTAPKLMVGSTAYSYSTPSPSDAGPTLNRVSMKAAGIADHTATIAQGPVGREVAAAGDSLVGSLKALHSNTLQRLPYVDQTPPTSPESPSVDSDGT